MEKYKSSCRFLTNAKGIIVDGKSSINESMLTGESRPVFKKEGESVYGKFAVTQNLFTR